MPDFRPMPKQVVYGGHVADVKPAAGITGILCRSIDGEYFLRVEENGQTVDYDLRHSDLRITIAPDEEAALYTVGEARVLDHAPQTLRLVPVSD